MGKKILVVDDSPTVRKMIESALKKEEYEVLCAEDKTSALDLAETSQLDLIFLDHSPPILDGLRLCEEFKKNEKLKNIPVIMLLDKPQMEKEKELRQAEVDAFMVKPFNPKDISGKVREFLNSENVNSKHEMQMGLKDKPFQTDEKPSIDKTQVSFSSSEKEEKTDGSLDIIETSDFLESLETGSPDTNEPHGFDWFVSELKRETEDAKQADLSSKRGSKERLRSAEASPFSQKKLKEKDKSEKKVRGYQSDEDRNGYESFLDELKTKSEKFIESIGRDGEKPLDQKISPPNYDKMIKDLIEDVSTRIAQEVAKKLAPQILKQILQNEVKKLPKKEEIKAS
jgi:two-component system chemotaxis response regulator CheY